MEFRFQSVIKLGEMLKTTLETAQLITGFQVFKFYQQHDLWERRQSLNSSFISSVEPKQLLLVSSSSRLLKAYIGCNRAVERKVLKD